MFKALVSITCIAVLGAVGWWGWQQRQLAQAKNKERAYWDCIIDEMAEIKGMTREVAELSCVFDKP